MKLSLALSILLLFAGGLWGKDVCTKSRMECPNNSISCIDEFWEKNANNIKEGIEGVQKQLPKMISQGQLWLYSIADTDERMISSIWKLTNDISLSKKDIEKMEREMVRNQCLLPLMCEPPGLKLRLSLFDSRDDLLLDFYMTRETCRHN